MTPKKNHFDYAMAKPIPIFIKEIMANKWTFRAYTWWFYLDYCSIFQYRSWEVKNCWRLHLKGLRFQWFLITTSLFLKILLKFFLYSFLFFFATIRHSLSWKVCLAWSILLVFLIFLTKFIAFQVYLVFWRFYFSFFTYLECCWPPRPWLIRSKFQKWQQTWSEYVLKESEGSSHRIRLWLLWSWWARERLYSLCRLRTRLDLDFELVAVSRQYKVRRQTSWQRSNTWCI